MKKARRNPGPKFALMQVFAQSFGFGLGKRPRLYPGGVDPWGVFDSRGPVGIEIHNLLNGAHSVPAWRSHDRE
jgi:hypothetical protein